MLPLAAIENNRKGPSLKENYGFAFRQADFEVLWGYRRVERKMDNGFKDLEFKWVVVAVHINLSIILKTDSH